MHPSTKDKPSIFHQAANAGFIAPGIAIGLTLSISVLEKSAESGASTLFMVLKVFPVLLLVFGMLAGAIALFGIPQHGSKGILVKSLAGIVTPIALTLLALPTILKSQARFEESVTSAETSRPEQALSETVFTRPKTSPSRSNTTDRTLERLAAQMNQGLPVKVETNLALARVKALPNKTLVREHTFLKDFDSGKKYDQAIAGLKYKLSRLYHTSAEFKTFRTSRVTILCTFSKLDGELVGHFKIGPTTKTDKP